MKTVIGILTHDELAKVAAQHAIKTSEIVVIEIDVTDTEQSVAYYKKPNRLMLSKAMQHFAKNELLECGLFLVKNTWIAGDDRQKSEALEHESINIAACVTINSNVDFLPGRLKSSHLAESSAQSLAQTVSEK